MNFDSFEVGDMVLVKWVDASDRRATLETHIESPEIFCKDWGIYLGVFGRKRKFMLLGKDIVELQNEWGGTRIPLELIEEVTVMLPKSKVIASIQEVQVIGSRIRLRRSRRDVSFRLA